MDTELREFLQQMEQRLEARLEAQASQVERAVNFLLEEVQNLRVAFEARMDALESRMDKLESQLSALRIEVTEKLMGIGERFRSFGLQFGALEARVAQELTENRHKVELLMKSVEQLQDRQSDTGKRLNEFSIVVGTMTERIDTLADDMRQRFRLVNDRLAGIEQRNVA
ncbi:MAG: hypothetical protein ACT443_00355 [Gemmatimonadota bacterium]